MTARVQYVGFAVRGSAREYALRVWQGDAGPYDFTLAIPNQAFLSRRVRYQDGPEVCFLKLQRELVACTIALPPSHLGVTDSDLEEYRIAHTPKPKWGSPASTFRTLKTSTTRSSLPRRPISTYFTTRRSPFTVHGVRKALRRVKGGRAAGG